MRSPTWAGVLWCLPAALAALLCLPCWQSVLGAVLGCLLATVLAARGRRKLELLAACLLWLALLGLALLAASRPESLLGLSPEARLLLWAGLVSLLGSSLLVSLLHRASGRLLLVLECALFATPWIVVLSDHRQGRLDQPVGLVEPAWAAGIDAFHMFAAFGLTLGVCLVLLIVNRQAARPSWRPCLVVLLLGLACFVALPTERLARLSSEVLESAEAPQGVAEKAIADAPVAVVVFYQDYQPESGYYHFALGEDPQPAPPTTGTVASSALRYRVAEIVEQPQRLLLGWRPEISNSALAEGEAFARVYEVGTTVLTTPLPEVLDRRSTAEVIKPTRYTALANEIVPAEERLQTLKAALRIKLWMEENRAQQEAESTDSVAACLLQRAAVGQQTYAEAAQQLMESLGMTTRLVHGYAVRSDQRGQGSFLLVSEQNLRHWVEVWVPTVGWMVMDLYPLDGPSDGDGPQNLALQRQLGELARGREKRDEPLPGLGTGVLGLLIFTLIVGAGGYGVKFYRDVRVGWCSNERLPIWGYLKVLDRLAQVGELRHAGETRHEFAIRLQERLPSLQTLTTLHLQTCLGRPGSANCDSARALVESCLREWRSSWPRHRRWAGACHPFSWMKVH